MITINLNSMTNAIVNSKGKNLIHKCVTIIQNTLQSPYQKTELPPTSSVGVFKFIVGGVTLTTNTASWSDKEEVLYELVSEIVGKLFLEIELSKFRALLEETISRPNPEQVKTEEKTFTDPYGYTHMLTIGENISYAVVDRKGENVCYVFGSMKKETSGIVYGMIMQAMQMRFQKHVINPEVEIDEEWCLNNNITYFAGIGPHGVNLQNVTFNKPVINPYNQLNAGFPGNVHVFGDQGVCESMYNNRHCYNPNSNVQQVGRPSQFQPY